MKQTIIIIGMTAMTVIVFLILLSANIKTERKTQLNRVVSTALKKTLFYSQMKTQNNITSDEGMVEQFVQNISLMHSGKSNLLIDVMGVDYKEGMLDVLVTEKFIYPNGSEGSVSVRKCAICERITENAG